MLSIINSLFENEKHIISKIQEASLIDVSSIQTLNKKLFSYESKNKYDSNLDLNWSLSDEGKKEIEERIKSANSCGFVLKIDNNVVGYLIGRILEDETGRSEEKYSELEHMFIDEKYRKMKFGEKLVQEFKNWTRSKDINIIKVNVSYKNINAIAFYKKVGMIPLDITLIMKV